jgi:hypothetical protein
MVIKGPIVIRIMLKKTRNKELGSQWMIIAAGMVNPSRVNPTQQSMQRRGMQVSIHSSNLRTNGVHTNLGL